MLQICRGQKDLHILCGPCRFDVRKDRPFDLGKDVSYWLGRYWAFKIFPPPSPRQNGCFALWYKANYDEGDSRPVDLKGTRHSKNKNWYFLARSKKLNATHLTVIPSNNVSEQFAKKKTRVPVSSSLLGHFYFNSYAMLSPFKVGANKNRLEVLEATFLHKPNKDWKETVKMCMLCLVNLCAWVWYV